MDIWIPETDRPARTIVVHSRRCLEHNSLDTNRDGMCIRYGTASREMRKRMEECRFEDRVVAATPAAL